MLSPDYPVLAEDWLRRKLKVDDIELIVASRRGYIENSEKIQSLELFEESDELSRLMADSEIAVFFRDKYFCLLLINLYETWFMLDKPRKALEYLVLDFRESPMINLYDSLLPTHIAGLSEPYDTLNFDEAKYVQDIKIHSLLGKYVAAIFDSGIIHNGIYNRGR